VPRSRATTTARNNLVSNFFDGLAFAFSISCPGEVIWMATVTHRLATAITAWQNSEEFALSTQSSGPTAVYMKAWATISGVAVASKSNATSEMTISIISLSQRVSGSQNSAQKLRSFFRRK
jgi:hypothetical protein